MARLSYLQCVNQVLRRLRQSEVASYADRDYTRLVGDFINQALREVENAHYWTDLRATVSLAVVAATQEYSLTNWQDRGRLDCVYNETNNRSKLRIVSDHYWQELYPSDKTGQPAYCRMFLFDTNGDPRLQLYPVPDASYTLTVSGWVGQADLSSDSATILVPTHPVILRAYAYAIQERGEDVGTSYSEAMNAADGALFEAIERDQESQAGGKVPTWSLG